jgi:hypothetical protein
MACDQSVRVWSNDKGVDTAFQLLCKQKCNDGDAKECAPKQRTEAVGTRTFIVQYCACDGGDGKESTACHIVLVTEKGGDDDGKQSYRCDEDSDNKCKGIEQCLPVQVPGSSHDVPIPGKDGKFRGKLGKRADYKCECTAPRDSH